MRRTSSGFRRAGSLTLLALASVSAEAQSPESAAPPTPLRLEGVATAPGALSAINGARSVSGGAVFVNDRARRRVIMLGRDLRESRVVLDGSPENGQRYGQFATRLFALTGDSTAFLDVESRTITVIDPEGNISRRVTVPKHADLESVLSGTPAVDERGRLIYRGRGVAQQELVELGAIGLRGMAESVPILRLDLTSGQLDTVTRLRTYQQREKRVPAGSRISYQPVLHPAPTVDEWVMLADGRIAVVRGVDYQVEFFAPDGRAVRAEPVRAPRATLDSAAKAALLDSSRAIRHALLAAGHPLGREVAPLPGAVFFSAPGTCLGMRASGEMVVLATSGCPNPALEEWVTVDEIGDRMPAFLPAGVRADADGNVWVQRISLDAGSQGLLYDVIDASGRLADRVRVPAGAVIVGFQAGGGVLLATRDQGTLRLRRARYAAAKPVM